MQRRARPCHCLCLLSSKQTVPYLCLVSTTKQQARLAKQLGYGTRLRTTLLTPWLFTRLLAFSSLHHCIFRCWNTAVSVPVSFDRKLLVVWKTKTVREILIFIVVDGQWWSLRGFFRCCSLMMWKLVCVFLTLCRRAIDRLRTNFFRLVELDEFVFFILLNYQRQLLIFPVVVRLHNLLW